MPSGFAHSFVERVDHYELLGALRTVGKGQMSARDWHRLWNG
jgi:hypothetical protein